MPRREPVVRRELVESAGWNNVRIEHEPDTELTLPLPTRILPSPRVLPLVDSEPAAASFTPVVMHARSSELSVVAFLSAVVTFGAVLFGQHAAHWGEARAQISERAPARQSTEQAEPLATRAASGPSWAATLTSNIPVVLLRDLPLERGGAARVESERGAAAPRFEVERGSTSRPAARASRAVAAAPAAPAPAPGPADRQRQGRNSATSSITSDAATGRTPPASGVTVKAETDPSGFSIDSTSPAAMLSSTSEPMFDDPWARPATVYASSVPLSTTISCPASITGTWNDTR